jgi:hypothetical protein
MSESSLPLEKALALTRTGDIWLFRGSSTADRAIRLATNAPINHVGMAVVIDDLPPLIWHAEMGKALVDVWSGTHHRGVQLHDLHDAVRQWHDRYGQRAWVRHLHPDVTPDQEDALLRTIARMDGTPFPSSVGLASRWLRGRAGVEASLETIYCAELVATTFESMGLLPVGLPENAYDPGSFWSGDGLRLLRGYSLGTEVPVEVPPLASGGPARADRSTRDAVRRRMERLAPSPSTWWTRSQDRWRRTVLGR